MKHVKKRTFYTQKLDKIRGDIKGTWRVLNNAMDKKSKSAKINSLKVHRKDISDPTEIAYELNSYFCATAERIQNEDASLKDKESTPSFEAFIKEIPKPAKNFQFKVIGIRPMASVLNKVHLRVSEHEMLSFSERNY